MTYTTDSISYHGEGIELVDYKREYVTDHGNYSGDDSGCKYATDYLGEQSSCFTCPWKRCILDLGGKNERFFSTVVRNLKIQRLFAEGHSKSELEKQFNLSRKTLNKALQKIYGLV